MALGSYCSTTPRPSRTGTTSRRLQADPNYRLIRADADTRNGFAVFERVCELPLSGVRARTPKYDAAREDGLPNRLSKRCARGCARAPLRHLSPRQGALAVAATP